jgi:hypothetical protein
VSCVFYASQHLTSYAVQQIPYRHGRFKWR